MNVLCANDAIADCGGYNGFAHAASVRFSSLPCGHWKRMWVDARSEMSRVGTSTESFRMLSSNESVLASEVGRLCAGVLMGTEFRLSEFKFAKNSLEHYLPSLFSDVHRCWLTVTWSCLSAISKRSGVVGLPNRGNAGRSYESDPPSSGYEDRIVETVWNRSSGNAGLDLANQSRLARGGFAYRNGEAGDASRISTGRRVSLIAPPRSGS
jgi:hypothetical protein